MPALQRSTNGGAKWTTAMSGIVSTSGETGVRCISVSDMNPLLICAGVTGSGYGLFRSTDGGDSWVKCYSVKDISEISIHPLNQSIIYISAIGTGVHRTTDGGATWMKISDGLPTTDVMRVRVAPGYPVRAFAVTLKHGIFRLVDEEIPSESVSMK